MGRALNRKPSHLTTHAPTNPLTTHLAPPPSSHKGSNLALMVELLAGPLVGAAVADKLEAKNWGNLVIAVDPELLGDREAIRARTQVRGAAATAVLACLAGWLGCLALACSCFALACSRLLLLAG